MLLKNAMRRGMGKLRGLKVICYADCIIEFNEYLDVLPGEKASEKIFETELDKKLLNIIPISVSGRHIFRGLFVIPLLKTYVNIFEHMEK